MARVLTWSALGLTCAMVALVVSSLPPWNLRGGYEHPIVDVLHLVVAWGYLLGVPVVSVAGGFLGRRSRRMVWVNAAAFVAWLAACASTFLPPL